MGTQGCKVTFLEHTASRAQMGSVVPPRATEVTVVTLRTATVLHQVTVPLPHLLSSSSFPGRDDGILDKTPSEEMEALL